jgi:hypothetical protein
MLAKGETGWETVKVRVLNGELSQPSFEGRAILKQPVIADCRIQRGGPLPFGESLSRHIGRLEMDF